MAAAVLLQVDHGTVTLADTDASVTDTLGTTLTDTSKAVLWFSARLDDASPANALMRGEITNTTTLTFNRNGTTGAVVIDWYVAEWSAGVSVQRGTVTGDGSTDPLTATISAVTEADTFILTSLENTGSTFNEDDFAQAELTSTTNINFTAGTALGTSDKINWQAVSYDDCTVQRGTLTLSDPELSDTATITAVVIAKSFVLTTIKVATSWFPFYGVVNTSLTATTTLTVSRADTGGTVDVAWQVVEFDDDTTVEAIAVAMADTVTTSNDTLTATVLAQTVVMTGGHAHTSGKGGKDFVGDNPGVVMCSLDISTTTNLLSTRALGDKVLSMEAYIVEFQVAAPTGFAHSHAVVMG